ncbi:hypothetical protein BYT27DRAFT_7200686 [Phlegmacium glaucopus]|nr:hypothetical protein BYT27DRAFT_7200686 [Phlegmacium glaucopus]
MHTHNCNDCVLRLWVQIQKFQVDMASKAIVSVALFQVESKCHGRYVPCSPTICHPR